MTTEQRLARLERRCRRLTVVAAVLATTMVVVFLTAAQRPSSEEVRTQRLVIVDETGRKVGEWDSYEEGSRASFYDHTGRERVYVFSTKKASGVHLENVNGKSAAYLHERAEWWGMKVFSHDAKNCEGGGLIAAPSLAQCWIHATPSGDDAPTGAHFGVVADGNGLRMSFGNRGRDLRINDDDADTRLTVTRENGAEPTINLEVRKALERLKANM